MIDPCVQCFTRSRELLAVDKCFFLFFFSKKKNHFSCKKRSSVVSKNNHRVHPDRVHSPDPVCTFLSVSPFDSLALIRYKKDFAYCRTDGRLSLMSFLPRACRATTSLSAALELTVLSFVAHPSCASAQKILLQSPGSLRRESRCPTKTNGGDRAAEETLSSTGILSSVRPLEESESLCCEQRNSKTTVTHDATSLAVPFSIAGTRELFVWESFCSCAMSYSRDKVKRNPAD